jgi:hypothetical protein
MTWGRWKRDWAQLFEFRFPPHCHRSQASDSPGNAQKTSRKIAFVVLGFSAKKLAHATVRRFKQACREVFKVATVQALPIYRDPEQKTEEKVLQFPTRAREVESIDLIFGMRRFWLMMSCLRHKWSWPRANKEERLHGFDAHQTCQKCRSTRFFDSHAWQAGPIYRQRQHAGA